MRIIICDGDPTSAEQYRRYVEALARRRDPDCLVEVLDSGERLLFEFSDEPDEADVSYMETDFPGKMDGVAAAAQLREVGFRGEIVFLTNNAERVFDSFEARPFQYLIKESTPQEKFDDVLTRAMDSAHRRKRETIALACAGAVRNIPLEEILYFLDSQRIVEVHYGDDIFEFYTTLDKLENQLYGKSFARVHRRYIVNTDRIASAKSTELVLDNGESIPVASRYSKTLKEILMPQ